MSQTTYGVFMPVVATRTESTSGATYSNGAALGKAMTVTVTPNAANATLYGDNAVAEELSMANSANVTLNTVRILLSQGAILFGETYSAATTGSDPTPETLKDGINDVAGYVGFGYIKNVIADGAKSFEVVWLPKVKFTLPEDGATTVGDSITFNTPNITGKAVSDEDGYWRYRYNYATETDAIAALKAKANIS